MEAAVLCEEALDLFGNCKPVKDWREFCSDLHLKQIICNVEDGVRLLI